MIDLKPAQRLARADAWAQTCPPETGAFREELNRTAGPALRRLREALNAGCANHRLYTRASKLCLDGEGRRQLHLRARSLESGAAAVACGLYVQGLEYAAAALVAGRPVETRLPRR